MEGKRDYQSADFWMASGRAGQMGREKTIAVEAGGRPRKFRRTAKGRFKRCSLNRFKVPTWGFAGRKGAAQVHARLDQGSKTLWGTWLPKVVQREKVLEKGGVG